VEHSDFLTTADGTDIWYGTVGSGPPLITCDGLACDGFIWPYLIDYLVQDYQIIRWHYRAHGRNNIPSEPGTLTIEQTARDLEAVREALGLEQAVLTGHSMGVQVILEYYRQFPDRVGGLIPMCGSYREPLDTFHNNDTLRRVLPYLRAVVDAAPELTQNVWEQAVPSTFSRLVATLAETNPRLMRSRDIDPYLEHVARMDVDAFVTFLENVADHNADPILPTIDVPTLVIAGDDDAFTPLFRSREMADAIEGAELLIVPGGTHVAPLETPDLINNQVETFLRSVYDRN
jgi:pimeloyl-ACP methyl ester carboxylesterase